MGKKTWSQKAKILAVSFLAAAFAVTGGFALQARQAAAAYRNALDNGYQHAFAELTTAVSELDAALQKTVYATSPSLISSLCTQIFGRAMSAQMAIGELPYGNIALEQTAAFIAKTGDYAAALSKSAAVNGACSNEERADLRSLAQISASLSQILQDLQADIHAGSITAEDLQTAEARLSVSTEDGGQENGGSAFQTVESDFPEVPSLIYDGPFSEHIAGRTPKMLAGMEIVTQDEAREAAAKFVGLKADIFALASSGEGRIPTWGFTAAVDGGELYIEVTQQGGLVTELMNSRPVSKSTLSATEAVRLAADFLTAQGYPDMAATYYIMQDHILTINFAAQQDGTICYPDLIKVSVALDNGRMVGFENAGYLMNHTVRSLSEPAVSLAQAQLTVEPSLNILSHQLALIPTGGEYEVLCHEFKCETGDGKHYIVYVNAQTGSEEKILILIEDETGTLAI